jgi:hypothetical protein
MRRIVGGETVLVVACLGFLIASREPSAKKGAISGGDPFEVRTALLRRPSADSPSLAFEVSNLSYSCGGYPSAAPERRGMVGKISSGSGQSLKVGDYRIAPESEVGAVKNAAALMFWRMQKGDAVMLESFIGVRGEVRVRRLASDRVSIEFDAEFRDPDGMKENVELSGEFVAELCEKGWLL